MENDGKFDLPQEIIEQIQSFLNRKEAAQTSILSKSWYSAWSTCPNLVFDQRHFPCVSGDGRDFVQNIEKLLTLAKKTMQRYEDQNLNIHTLTLFWRTKHPLRYLEERTRHCLTTQELIVKAMRLGAVDLNITVRNSGFDFPKEVLRSQTLTRLSLTGVEIDDDEVVTNLSKLKSLRLTDVSGDFVTNLISRCPLIEELEVVSSIKFEFKVLIFLFLHYLNPNPNPNFGCLKELVIRDGYRIYSNHVLSICIPSLERITIQLDPGAIWTMKFDVPNIRKFELHGSPASLLQFKTTSCREWESDVFVGCCRSKPKAWWFSSLGRLLRSLRHSKVSLSIDAGVDCSSGFGLIGDEGVVVENLKLKGSHLSPAFLDSLFSVCRPKFISEYRCGRNMDVINKYLVELGCKGIVEVHNVGRGFRLRW